MTGKKAKAVKPLCVCFVLAIFFSGCATKGVTRKMNTTAYCGCSKCCGWQKGTSKHLKVKDGKQHITRGKNKGKRYSGLTASGTRPKEPVPGLFSKETLNEPWTIPVKVLLFPLYLKSKDGTIAADTRYYRFGTRMYVTGYGWGRVEDRGGAVKGPNRIDLYFRSHRKALNWGKRNVDVIIHKK